MGQPITRDQLRQEATAAAEAKPRARVLRLWLDITDDRAVTKRYTIVPLPKSDTILQGYRLARVTDQNPRDSCYHCQMDVAGQLTCTCKGWAHTKHCKHLHALQAAGLICHDLVMQLRSLVLDCEQRKAALDNARASFEEAQRNLQIAKKVVHRRTAKLKIAEETPCETSASA